MGKGLSLADCAFLKNGGFSPASISGLYRWWKASQYDGTGLADGTSCGGGVNTGPAMIDYSGNGDNAQQLIFGGPHYKTNIFGTQSAILFGGAAGINFDVGPFVIAGDFTAVLMVQNIPGDKSIILSDPTLNHQIRTQNFGSPDGVFYCGTGVPVVALGSQGPYVITCRRTAGNVTFRVNLAAESASTAAAGNWTTSQLGQQVTGTQHYMGEVILYNTSISNADLTLLYNSYLKPKFTILP